MDHGTHGHRTSGRRGGRNPTSPPVASAIAPPIDEDREEVAPPRSLATGDTSRLRLEPRLSCQYDAAAGRRPTLRPLVPPGRGPPPQPSSPSTLACVIAVALRSIALDLHLALKLLICSPRVVAQAGEPATGADEVSKACGRPEQGGRVVSAGQRSEAGT